MARRKISEESLLQVLLDLENVYLNDPKNLIPQKTMLTHLLFPLFERDLQKLITEIESYPTEESLWKTVPGIANSGGTLALHLIGNLNHFIGAVLGKTGYIRNREAEFADRNVPRQKLNREIGDTLTMIATTFQQLTTEELEASYPIDVFGEPMKTAFFLIHLESHLGYHLGQVNYHRRIVGRE